MVVRVKSVYRVFCTMLDTEYVCSSCWRCNCSQDTLTIPVSMSSLCGNVSILLAHSWPPRFFSRLPELH